MKPTYKAAVAVFSLLGMLTSYPAISGDIENINKAMAKRFPSVTVDKIEKTVVPGLYQLVAGGQVVYVDGTGRYMIDGDLVDMDTRRNYTEDAKSDIRVSAINQLTEDEMLVYQPEKVKHTVTIVTDIDCPYCRKLHNEMDEYLDNNIKVRYLLLPLKGRKDYQNSVSVWCSDDRNLALDIAKAGGDVESKTCAHPLQKHQQIARKMGVNGTPAIILESGRLLPGYVPIAELLKVLVQEAS